MVGLCCANIVLFVGAKFYYIWRNKSMAKKFEEAPMSEKSKLTRYRFAH